MATTDELLDILMKDYKKPEDLIGENGLLKQLTKRLLERAMQTEMTDLLAMTNMLRPVKTAAILATERPRRRLRVSLEIWTFLFPATGTRHLSLSLFPKGKAASPALVTRLSPCMPVG